ncbi:MAG TPA: orotidine 5'-phosphate decarboxylase [Nitrososphaerales archaeon]|nr:orotidine 5'-phosphate decarboxylase [Nitrososphaerales archaeon]
MLALDFAGPFNERLASARRILEKTRGGVAAVKLNHHLILPFGLEGLQEVIADCKAKSLPVIADLKMNDIESTNLNIVDSLLTYGIDAVIANPFVGKEEGLGEAIEVLHRRGGGILLLVYMSHRGAREGFGLKTEGGVPLYRVFAERAKQWRADGVVVSAKSADIMRETRTIVGKRCLIFAPGIGAQGGAKTSATDADFMIVGRSITEAADPTRVLRKLNSG